METVNYSHIKFHDTGARAQCYKTFYVRNLGIFILSQNVCQTRGQCYETFFVRHLRIFILIQSVCQSWLDKLTKDKHSSLLRKSVIYGQEQFYNIGPRLEKLDRDKCSSLVYKFVNYGRKKLYNIGLRSGSFRKGSTRVGCQPYPSKLD